MTPQREGVGAVGFNWTLFWCFVALISALGVFVVPFAFPQRYPTFSSSYTYGFSNRTAYLASSLISAAVLLALWWRGQGRLPAQSSDSDSQDAKMPRLWLGFGALAAILFTAWLGGRLVHANYFFDDAGYIQMQIERALHDHAVLYRDIEWPYGPLLFYWPLATIRLLAPLGVGELASYMVTLALMQVAGIVLLFYILEWLPLSRTMRGIAFVVLTLGTLNTILGLNYTLFRFLAIYAVFLAAVGFRSIATQATLFAAGEVLLLGISPELGFAFIGGVGCYSLYRAFTSSKLWLIAAVAPLAGFAVFNAIMGRDYFAFMKSIATGGFNMLLVPEFHILFVLVAAIALSPIAVAPFLRTRDSRAAAMLGFYIISIAMTASAFGRSDPLHAFYDGLGVCLLALLAVDRRPGLAAKAWVIAFVLFVYVYQYDKFNQFRPLLAQFVFHGPAGLDIDMARLEEMTHGEKITTPVELPQALHQELIRRGQLQPSSTVYLRTDWDPVAEQTKIAEMRQAPYALIPNKQFAFEYEDPDPRRRIRVLRFGYNYRKRFTPWISGAGIIRELQTHWTMIGSVGNYSVYRQNQPDDTASAGQP